MTVTIGRRELLAALGGAAAAWPLAARAQQPERMRRVAILLPAAAGDSAFQTRVGAFLQGLQQLGWFNGHNVSIDTRWATANAAEIRRHAAELVALAEMWALSPSQYENVIAKQNLGSLIVDQTTPEARIPDRNPNHASVASALIVGDCHILLGADLEEPGDARLGWSAVVSNPGRPDLHSSVFKIPHHGSITAHHDDTWQQLITRSPGHLDRGITEAGLYHLERKLETPIDTPKRGGTPSDPNHPWNRPS